jgi:hypothetical protein
VWLTGISNKSQIAIEYCYRFQEGHAGSHIFWIYASSAAKIREGFLKKVARELDPPGCDRPEVDMFKLVGSFKAWILAIGFMVLGNIDD